MDSASPAVFIHVLRNLNAGHPSREVTQHPGLIPAGRDIGGDDAPAIEALTVLEGELRRIAGDLHDTAAQALAIARMSIEAAARSGAGDGAERAAEALPVIDAAIAQVRQVIHGLRPPLLDELGLAAALGWCLTNLTRAAELDTEMCTGEGLTRLSPETEVACYRIGQEAIANAVRHAGAHRLTVRIDQLDGMLLLEVADDGQGMPDAGGPPGGRSTLGVRVMAERAATVGGRVVITSQPGSGTRVLAMLPILPFVGGG